MKKLLTSIIMLLCLCLGASAQQTIEVKGKVTDANNQPLIGVAVVAKDQLSVGTTTDTNGNFTLRVAPYSVLIISYVGYERQEINIETRTNINVVLQSDNVLDEVVVTAAGAQRKVTTTGAISTVDMSSLSTPTSNLSNALLGQVAGIIGRQASGEPGANQTEFWIRGISTFGANQGALVLVDGFERSFNEINIEDIESFSVLKDASATAIYGSKGANGVLLITTKRGDAGKINVNAKVEYAYNTRTRTPEFIEGNQYAQMVNEALITRNREPLYTDTELDILRYQLDPDLYPNVDWMDLLMREGASTYRANLSISGGGTVARYFVSGSYVEEGGMYKTDKALKDYNTNSNLRRWNYRMNFDIDASKTTLISIGVAGFLEKQNSPGLNDDIWASLVGQTPVSIPVLYSNGAVPAHATGYQTNPWVLATQTGWRDNWKNQALVNINLKQDLSFLTEGLRFEARANLDNDSYNSIRRIKWPEQYRAERRRDLNGELVLNRVSTEQLLTQSYYSEGERKFTAEAEMHYNRLFADRHRVGGLVKFHQREVVTTAEIGSDLRKGIPLRNSSLSGRATYGYMDRYLLEFNFAYMGSENFRKGHQFGFFPAISAGWNIAEERFVKNAAPWLTMAKIRYSYGEVGNSDLGKDNRFPYLTKVDYRRNSDGDYETFNYGDYNQDYTFRRLYQSKTGADNLTWEVARKHNLGFDINILNNRFTLTMDVFKDNRSGIFMERSHLSSMVGVTSRPWANVGKMESKGFDGNFAYKQKISEVEFTVRGNITYAKNELIEYDEMATALPYQMSQGYRYKQVKGLIALGLFEDFDDIRNSPKQTFGEYLPGDIKYKDVNGDGVIDDDDVVAVGATQTPNLVYGLGISVLWKGFDLNVHFQGSGKSSIMIEGSSVYPFVHSDWGNIFKSVASPNDRWISREISGDPATERTDAKYPRLSYGGNANNYRASTFWLRDGRYLRLKTLEIGYTFPKNLLAKIHLQNARVFFVGNNLFLWDKLKLWDPELDTTNGQKYPLSRTFTVGLSFNF